MRLPLLNIAACASLAVALSVFASCSNTSEEDGNGSSEATSAETSATDYNAMNEEASASSEESVDSAGTSSESDSSAVDSGTSGSSSSNSGDMEASVMGGYANRAEAKIRGGDYSGALEIIRTGLSLDGTDRRLLRQEREVMALLGKGVNADPDVVKAEGLSSEAQYEIGERVREAQRFLQEQRYTEAIESAESAKDLVRYAGWMVNDDTWVLQANEIIERASKERELQRRVDRQQLREQRRRRQEMAAIAELEQFRSEIRAKFEEAKRQFDQREYEESIRILNHILHRDPHNDPVKELKTVAQELSRAAEDRQTAEEFRRRWQVAMAELEQAYAFPVSSIEWAPYDRWISTDRRAERIRRGSTAAVDKEDLAVRASLEAQFVRVDISADQTLKSVLDEWKRLARINIVYRDVDGEGEIGGEGIQLGEMPLNQALNILQSKSEEEFQWFVANGVVNIVDEIAEGDGTQTTRIFNVADVLINLPHFIATEPILADEQDGRFPPDNNDVDASAFEVESEDLVDMIMESIDAESWEVDPQYRQGQLIVTNSLENIGRVEQLLNDLRSSQGLVVNIETRFITIRDDFLQDIGIDFRGVGGAPVGANPQPVTAALDDVNVGTNNVPVGAGTDNEAGFFFQDINPNQTANTDIRGRVENLFDQAVGGRRAGFGLTNEGGASFQLSFVDNPEVTAVIRAVKKKERAALLTSPSISVHNTQRGYVSVLNELSYISDFQVNVAANASIADPIVDIIRDGIVLDVRPTISSDRRYVTLELRPTLATLLRPISTINTTLAVGPPVSIQTPELQLQRLRTTVTVPDRGSFLIGGLRRLVDTELTSGVPILSDLPIIGWLFTRKAKNRVRQDIIIIVSVEIVDLSERAERFSGTSSR